MKNATTFLVSLVLAIVTCSAAAAQSQQADRANQLLEQQYGPNYEEIIAKYSDDPVKLQEAADAHWAARTAKRFFFERSLDDHYIVRSEAEPNNFFDTADNINDVLATPGHRGDGEFTGGLIEATFTEDDFDVYVFTVDTTKMYYFGGSHSYSGTVNFDSDDLGVSLRLFHESDLDTTFVIGFNGLDGNDQIRGDILGETTDHRANSGDFRLTGWVSPIEPATGQQLTGDFYLFIYNGEEGGSPKSINSLGGTGTYHFSAYAIDMEPWVSKAEPNQTFQEALLNADSALPPDGVVRTFMAFNADTIKAVKPTGSYAEIRPTQGNNAFPQLLAQGDEDVDHYRIEGLQAGHRVVIETLPYYGWYRDTDGSIGPGNTRWTDSRCRLFNADYTDERIDSDDDAREVQSTSGQPNNIHCRVVYDVRDEDIGAPMWLWVSAWASATRDPDQSVDNRDPGRFMYDIYVHQYSIDPVEVEPNNTVAEATSIGARADTVVTGSFSDGADDDYYRVFLHAQRMYSIFTQNSTVGDDIQVEIVREFESDNAGGTDVTGDLLAADPAGNAGSNDFLIAGFIPEESGAYLIKLSSASAGDYEFGVVDKGTVFQGLVANEPDDVLADATGQEALEVGPGAAARTAMIFPSGDVDHYYFNVNAGFDLTLTIGGSQEIVDDFAVEMTLMDPGGNVIETSGSGISHTTAEDGQYVVMVNAANGTDVGFYTLSGGEPFEETEGNDTFETANAIALGNIYEASLGANDTDFFQFTLEAGKLYSFRSLDNETGGALTVEFFDEAGGTTLLDDSDWFDEYSGDNFKISNIIPRETKTYYLKISGNPGPYKITSRINPDYYALNHKGEPDNSIAEADAQGDYQAFGADQQFVLSRISHPRLFGDTDFFRVTLAAGQTLVAETKPVGGDDWNKDTDTRLVILSADGTELDNDDDGGNEWYSLATYTATADGPVYVQVRTSRLTNDADDRSLNRGDYILNIDVTSAEIEPNNSFADANGNALTPGFVEATFEEGDAVDIFKLSLQADHIYHVRTLKPEDGYSGEFSAKLFKASDTGTNLLNEANAGYNTRYSEDNLKLNIIPDETGDYFLQLDGDGTGGAYKVGLKGRDISSLKDKGEPNNSIADADAIGAQEFNVPGEADTYMLYNAAFPWDPAADHLSARFGDDLDFYKYELSAGDTLVAESSPVDGPLWPRDYDGFMELHNANGDVIDTNDDGGFDWHSRIEFVATSDTTVYVLLRSQDFEGGDNGGGTDRDPSRGEYNLTVTKMDGTPVVVTNIEDETPLTFELNQNYPNPFNPATTITYTVPEARKVSLAVYNLLGQRVAVLVNELQPSGVHAVTFDASRLASGVYFYQLRAGDFVQTKKMLLIK